MKSLAEQNRAFILYIFRNLSGIVEVQVPYIGPVGEDYGGLYLFYAKRRATDEDYPAYVGYTRRSFRERFGEHATKGVINDFFGHHFPKNFNQDDCDLYVIQYKSSPSTAKLYESIFLSTFDFPRNLEENGNITRDTFDLSETYDIPASTAWFKEEYQDVKHSMSEFERDVGALIPIELKSVEKKKPQDENESLSSDMYSFCS